VSYTLAIGESESELHNACGLLHSSSSQVLYSSSQVLVLHHTSWQNSAEESSTTVPFIPISGFWFLDAVLVLKIFVLYNFSTTCSEGTVLVSFSNPCRDNPLFFSNACAFYSCSIRFYGFAQIFPFCLSGIFTFFGRGGFLKLDY
jgi:hypothetical protein